MAYTAFEKMRRQNQKLYGAGTGPYAPPVPENRGARDSLKACALRFLREDCEGLRFDAAKEVEEKQSGRLLGASRRAGQIPYNMQMDIDRLCLEQELARFIDSGTPEDAYTVYYAFLEMFVGSGACSRRMVELLSEFESNASSLLMKHRDHYSHSVYVFALGLAVYESNAAFRGIFGEFYGFKKEARHESAAFFLEYWGLTALFHDIGYPFEIPFEQVAAYFELQGMERGEGAYLSYRGMKAMTGLSKKARAHLFSLFGRRFSSLEELLAYGISERLGKDYAVPESYLLPILKSKPSHPEKNGYFMDHALFSAARLFGELISAMGEDGFRAPHLDVLSAIALHNSLFKFSVNFYKSDTKRRQPLQPGTHPLAWLLMLCDELQCWDRTAYGRNSRTELYPMAADFAFSNDSADILYIYDAEESAKIRAYDKAFLLWEGGPRSTAPPRLKAYSDMAKDGGRFLSDIEKIADLRILRLNIRTGLRPADRSSKHVYLSVSSFLHMYDFAMALNARYLHTGREDEIPPEQLKEEFDALSLEYRLSNINQVKSFSVYLHAIGCFYTDKPVDFDMVRRFSSEETAVFAPMEHARWVREHLAMGWRGGDLYEHLPVSREDPAEREALRERFRMHRLCLNGDPNEETIRAHYEALPPAEQQKDSEPFNSMLRLIRRFDGLRIYRLEDREALSFPDKIC